MSDDPVASFRLGLKTSEGIIYYEFTVDLSTNRIEDEIVYSFETTFDDSLFYQRCRNSLEISGKTMELNPDDYGHKLLVEDISLLSDELLSVANVIKESLYGTVITTYDVGYIKVYDKMIKDCQKIKFSESDIYYCSPEDAHRLSGMLGFIGIDKVEFKPLSVEKQDSGMNSGFFILPNEMFFYDKHDDYIVQFREEGFDRLKSFSELSAGSQRVISIIIAAFEAGYIFKRETDLKTQDVPLNRNVIPTLLFVVDEMCYSLHPRIAKDLLKIIKEIYSGKMTLQMIYTVHNTEVMSFADVRPDSVYLLNRTDSASTLCRLSDFDDIGNWDSDSIKTGYLEGRFGGIPRTRNYWRLFNDS